MRVLLVVHKMPPRVVMRILRHDRTVSVSGCSSTAAMLGIAMAAHLYAETMLPTLERLMVVGSSLGSSSNSNKTPTVQLASKGGVFGLLVEIFREDVGFKVLIVIYHKSPTVWEPSNDLSIHLIVKDLHELCDIYS